MRRNTYIAAHSSKKEKNIYKNIGFALDTFTKLCYDMTTSADALY